MKASKTITVATAVVALSVSLAACGEDKTVTADCVDKATGKILPDSHCSSGGSAGGGVFIYGGTVGGDGRVSGGSYSKPANTNISTRSGKVLVGGFGGSGKGGSGS
ncbi:hypothetical protein [Nonomuraea typhae]|uniref:Lipoprotein n=1 Tax=Nonomuraea typhae TaxID=2603600 RepID=A0ABW7YNF7_9ACTN